MEVRIRIVGPIVLTPGVDGSALVQAVIAAARPDVQVDCVYLDAGPASVESEYDEALAVPDIVRKVIGAERDGCDGVVIDCMGDPGLYPARQAVSIPVLGPYQTAGHLAASLGHRFAVVTVVDAVVPMFWDRAAVYGFRDHLASVRVVHIPVLELHADRRRMVDRIVDESAAAIREDGADTIVFGCTGMAGVADAVATALAARGLDVPVVDPAIAALKACEALVDMRLHPSRRAFPRPAPKPVAGYPGLSIEHSAAR